MTDGDASPSAGADGEDGTTRLGRLVVVSGPMGSDCHRLAWAMARQLDESVVVDGPILAAMIASEHASGADELGTIRTSLLRYCGQIALAETYRRAGYDVVVVEDLPGQRLADFRDLAEPDDIHLVVLDGSREGYPVGLHVESAQDVEALATAVLARLDAALLTAAPEPTTATDAPAADGPSDGDAGGSPAGR